MAGWLQAVSSFVTALLTALVALRFLMRRDPHDRQYGPWRSYSRVGSASASLYTKAYAARHATFALGASETLYFTASQDSSGRKLQADVTYSIQGRDPDVRWWSLTVYRRGHLVPNSLNRYSFSKTSVRRESDGTWTIRLSSQPQPENWLPSGDGSEDLTLLFRCYGPGQRMLSSPEAGDFPEILESRNP